MSWFDKMKEQKIEIIKCDSSKEIEKILGHRDISMLVEVYGHTLEEKIFEEFNQIRDVWKDCS